MALTVNGVRIEDESVDSMVEQMREHYALYARKAGAEPSETQLRNWVEETLVEDELFRRALRELMPDPPEARVLKLLEEEPEAHADCAEEGRRLQATDLLRHRAWEKKIRRQTPMPDEATLRRYYDEHPEAFTTSDILLVSHICRAMRPEGDWTRAEGYLDLLRIKSSVESGQASWHEVLDKSDTFREDFGVFDKIIRGMLPPDVEAQIFDLAIGGISDVIELNGETLHLFRVLERESSIKMPFKQVRDHLATHLFEQAVQKQKDDLVDSLKAQAVIQRDPP